MGRSGEGGPSPKADKRALFQRLWSGGGRGEKRGEGVLLCVCVDLAARKVFISFSGWREAFRPSPLYFVIAVVRASELFRVGAQ